MALGMFPEWYGPPQADWPPQMQLTGFPLFDGRQGNELPASLMQFCGAGSPPVAFTFGTGMAHPADLFRSALEACRRLGVRGIFLTKYRDQLPAALPSTVVHHSFAPFQKLFPRCTAVVHHGGIGTVAEAMAAGLPQLICPIAFDQTDSAVRTKKLGAGDWLAIRARDGRRIADALTRLMTLETRSRCRVTAERLKNSDALELAAKRIETLSRIGNGRNLP
jgi:UDP:flavonoid glycosyltransferase YjiC (YdhE family)